MSSIWEFIKKHKGKIVAGGITLGSIYTAKKIYDSDLYEEYFSSSNKTINEQEKQLLLAKKHFIFDTHQQTCNKTLIDTILDIKLLIKNRYPIETLVDMIKNQNITSDEKIKLFEDIKIKSITRIISLSFAYSLIIIASKTQKSIICYETFKNFEKLRKQQNDGVLTYVSSLIFGNDDNKKRQSYIDPKVQQVFLNCIQYLTTSGLNQLFNKIDGIVEETMIDYQLNKMMNLKNFTELFDVIIDKVEKQCGTNNYADLIVPLTNVHTTFNNQDSTYLESLLTRFVKSLRLNTCKQLMQLFVRRFISTVNIYLRDELNDVEQPLAKFLPPISDSFNIEAKNTPESPFQDCLNSHELHQFTLMAFSSDQQNNDDFGLD